MSALWWQYAVIAALVAASLLYMVRKLAPDLWRGARAAIAGWLSRRQAASLRALGQRLAPPRQQSACGSGGCDGCDAAADAMPPLEQVVTLHRGKRRR